MYNVKHAIEISLSAMVRGQSMKQINIFANKVFEDMSANLAQPVQPKVQLKRWFAYAKDGVDGYMNTPTPSEWLHSGGVKIGSTEQSDASSVPRQPKKAEVFGLRGARAGYLAGCALMLPIDVVFGTSESTSGVNTAPRRQAANDAPRVGYNIFRARPAFAEANLTDGLAGQLYVAVAGVAQWVVGNIGALVAATGFGLAQAVRLGAGSIMRLFSPTHVSLREKPSADTFATGIKRAAQQGDVYGSMVAGAPLYLVFGVATSGATLASGAVKGICAATGALAGACVAGGHSLVNGDIKFAAGANYAWTASKDGFNTAKNKVVDAFDSSAKLRRAAAQAANRDVQPEDIVEVMSLHHADEDDASDCATVRP
jgi:hypothetical protein